MDSKEVSIPAGSYRTFDLWYEDCLQYLEAPTLSELEITIIEEQRHVLSANTSIF